MKGINANAQRSGIGVGFGSAGVPARRLRRLAEGIKQFVLPKSELLNKSQSAGRRLEATETVALPTAVNRQSASVDGSRAAVYRAEVAAFRLPSSVSSSSNLSGD